jgi:tetratricopeptide (TPR) repeat protein
MLIRPVQHEWEIWKWLAAIALASVLTLAFATAVAAADIPDRSAKPGLLPSEIVNSAVPMEIATQEIEEQNDDLGCALWQIFELQRKQKHEAAVIAWNDLTVPPDTVFWKWVALGQAASATGKFDEAEKLLGRAMDMRPEYAVPYYFRGILRMQQAYLAREWPDNVPSRRTRLVDFNPRQVVPNTKGMYELAATMDFEKAIELANTVLMDEAIIPNRFPTATALEPTVGDLLVSLGAESFRGKAHNTLGYLHMERGALDIAEEHMDHAVREGLAVVYGYHELGDKYHALGQHANAMRAHLKATKFSSNKMHTLLDAMRSLREVFTNP